MKTILGFLAILMLVSLASNQAQEVSIPDPGLNTAIRQALQKPTGPLTQQDMLGLTNLSADGRSISTVEGLEAARNLKILDLGNNSITNFTIASALTNLTSLDLFNNHLTSFVLSNGSQNLNILDLGFNSINRCVLPDRLTNLNTLFLEGNRLTNLTLPSGLTALIQLDLAGNALTRISLPADATNLANLLLFGNQLTNVALPANLNRLSVLLLDFNRLSSLALPAGLTNLGRLTLNGNQLTNLFLPEDMMSLSFLDVRGNQLTSLTLPPGVTNLTALFVEGNPLTTLVLSEPLAATGLATTVANLRNQGVQVFTYPLSVQLTLPRQQPMGAFRFGITGPPGVYTVLSSSNLTDWNVLNFASNPLGSVFFTDTTAHLSPRKFYRASRVTPPVNMVFIPPNTFTMGSPTNDLDSNISERPQTIVNITRGFWIGKYEVTQGEYLDVTGTNPSEFPGDLNRPVSSVSWFDATNYCWQLTQRERAAGRIPAGSQYRLPTEAEWECAARAGTSTRFSYGDDAPNYASLTNYAWFLDLGHPDLTVHAVGQKLPNPWGLHDIAGNVWEWCQDWYGDLTGGVQTDPTGPVSNPGGVKVMRGGAYDYPNSSCRSASRLFRHALIPDSDLGFRVVLAVEP